MPKVRVRRELCKGCRLCIEQCPQGRLELAEDVNERGWRFVTVAEDGECTGCGNCAIVCPDAAIEILDEEEKR